MENIFHFISSPLQNATNSILNPELVVAIIAATTTIITIIYTKYRERKDSIIKELREKKIPVYKELIVLLIEFKKVTQRLNGIKEESVLLKKFDELAKKAVEIGGKIVIWASDDVLKNWLLFIEYNRKESTEDSTIRHKKIASQLDKLLLSIRKDLGHKNKAIQENEISNMFL